MSRFGGGAASASGAAPGACDEVYCDWLLRIAYELGQQAPDPRYQGWKRVETLLVGMSPDCRKRLTGAKDGNVLDVRVVDVAMHALLELGRAFPGPRQEISALADALAARGVEIDGVSGPLAAGALAGSWEAGLPAQKNVPYESWQTIDEYAATCGTDYLGDWRACDQAFVDVVRAVAERCVRRLSPSAAGAGAPVAAASQLALVSALLLGTPVRVEVTGAGMLEYVPDPAGPADWHPSDAPEDVLAEVLPPEVLLGIDGGIGAARLLDAGEYRRLRAPLATALTCDGGLAFSKMVARCAATLSPMVDDALLADRCDALFGQIARMGDERWSAAVRATATEFRRYTRRSAPRLLAAATLALALGPECDRAFADASHGRWN